MRGFCRSRRRRVERGAGLMFPAANLPEAAIVEGPEAVSRGDAGRSGARLCVAGAAPNPASGPFTDLAGVSTDDLADVRGQVLGRRASKLPRRARIMCC
jgi:predicted ATPase with chaperone activity